MANEHAKQCETHYTQADKITGKCKCKVLAVTALYMNVIYHVIGATLYNIIVINISGQ